MILTGTPMTVTPSSRNYRPARTEQKYSGIDDGKVCYFDFMMHLSTTIDHAADS
jgi:hypothetical protein